MKAAVSRVGPLPLLDCAAGLEGRPLRVGGQERPPRAAARQRPEVHPSDLLARLDELLGGDCA